MNARVLIGVGLAGAAALAVGLAVASSKPATTPAAAGGAPWHVTQGRRYLVTLTAVDGTANLAPLSASAGTSQPFTFGATGYFQTVPGSLNLTQTAATFQIDAIGPTHDELASTFLVGATGNVSVTLHDVGPTPASTTSTTTPTGSGGALITLVPNQPAASQGASMGDAISVGVPAGGAWAMGGNNPTSGSTPVSWTYQGPGVVNFVWTAPDGSAQTTAMTFYTLAFGGSRPPGGPFAGYGAPFTPTTPTSTPTPAPSSSSAPAPTGAPSMWQPAASVPYLWRARFTLTADQLTSLLSSSSQGATPSRDALSQRLAAQQPQSLLQSSLYFCWGPGDVLPSDWPPDDAHLADGYHVEVLYGVGYILFMMGNSSALPSGPPPLSPADLSAIGLSVSGFWAPTGSPSSMASIAGPSLTWSRTTQINPGDHVRMAIAASDVAALVSGFLAQYPNLSSLGYDPTCLAFLAMAESTFGRLLVSSGMLAWCAGAPLPPDWPADDAQAAGEYHLELRYTGPTTSTFGVPMSVWVGT